VLDANAGLLDDAERELAALLCPEPQFRGRGPIVEADSRISTMTRLIRLFLIAGACAFGAAALGQAAAPTDNSLEIVVDNGPHAGTYKLQTSAVMCMHFKQQKQVTAVYKDFDASDPNKIGEAGINITNPDATGPKRGDVLVAFGARESKSAARYSVSIPGDSAGPITLTRSGKEAGLSFQGRTKDGISLRVTAKCTDVEEL
jgi:hypothetical protein